VDVHDGFLQGTRALVIPAGTRATVLLDQTHLTTAYPEVDVSGGAGASLTLTYAEALFDAQGHKGHRDEIEGKEIRGQQDRFLPDGGAHRVFRPLWWRTYRYLQLDVETAAAPLTLHDVRGVFTAYPFEQRARFAGSDPTLATIWTTGWRTARLCAGETYFDCPYYEQLQYVGDTRIQALISLYVSGDDRLVRQAIRAFDHSREPEGLTQSRYPTSETQYLPPYSLFWIGMVHDYWMHRDDPAFVGSFLNGIRGVVDWYERRLDANGLVGPTPWWNFVDWSFERGVPAGADAGGSSIIALQFAYALGQAADLAAAFDRPDDAAHYRRLADRLSDAVWRLCWDERRGLFADTPEKTAFSEHANVLAVLAGLIPPDGRAPLLRRMLDAPDLTRCTYYFRFYLDRAMKQGGLADTYLERLGPWRDQLALGLTTFAEEPEPTRSDAHAWSASPNYEFLATVCGIEPATPGFTQVRVAPALGPLSSVDCRVPHPAGPIDVTLRRTAGGIEGDVALPAGLSGTFAWGTATLPLKPGPQRVALPAR
jgi:alpha-L-rhamnosidase